MSKGGRRKGREAENEFAAAIGGERISSPGLQGADVKDSRGNVWEVKRRKTAPEYLYNWVRQARRQKGYRLAFRANHKEWLVIIPLKEFLIYVEQSTAESGSRETEGNDKEGT